ncbi:MAG: hypothetical protein ACO3S8_02795 [Aquiluna sp.]
MLSVGIDIGGTKILGALVDESGKVVHALLRPRILDVWSMMWRGLSMTFSE